MTAYIVARVDVKDPTMLMKYQAAVPPIVEKYGGKFIARGGSVITLEGPTESRRMVLIEFPDLTAATTFFNSPEYTETRKLRDGVAIAEFVAIDGV